VRSPVAGYPAICVLPPFTESCERSDLLRESGMAQCRRTFFLLPISRRQMMIFTGVIMQARGEPDLFNRSVNHCECLYKAGLPPSPAKLLFRLASPHPTLITRTALSSPFRVHTTTITLDRQNSIFSQQTKIYHHGLNLERRLAHQASKGKLSVYLRVCWRGSP